MIAAPPLKQVPSKKEDWELSEKTYFLTQANSKQWQVLEYLYGSIDAPADPSTVVNFKQKQHLEEKQKEFKQKNADAWTFIYTILHGTFLDSILVPYTKNRDAAGAWTSLINYYEGDINPNTQRNLELKLEDFVIKDTQDLKLDFTDAVNQIERYSNALAALPVPYKMELNSTSKKLKLEQALARTPRFDKVIDSITTDPEDYEDYKVVILKSIETINKNKTLRDRRLNSATDTKNLQIKNEKSTTALSTSISESEDISNLNSEELEALRVEIQKNRNRVYRAIDKKRKFEKPADESSNHLENRPDYSRPFNWRGGRRADIPRGHRGGRSNYRGRGQKYGAQPYNRENQQNYVGNSSNYDYSNNSSNSQNQNQNRYNNDNNWRGRNSYRGRGFSRGGRGHGGRGRHGGRYNQNYLNSNSTQQFGNQNSQPNQNQYFLPNQNFNQNAPFHANQTSLQNFSMIPSIQPSAPPPPQYPFASLQRSF